MKKYYTNVWWWWFCLTVVYVGWFIVVGAQEATSNIHPISDHIFAFIGLFVPVGFWTAAILFHGGGLIAVPIAIAIFILEKYFVNKSNLKNWQKMFLALLTLLITTLVVDLIVFHAWNSFYIFWGGDPHIDLTH